MKKTLYTFLAAVLLTAYSCGGNANSSGNGNGSGNNTENDSGGGTDPGSGTDPGGSGETPSASAVFAKGADIGWVTEMEAKGYKFYDASGKETECTALMKSLGLNSVRYRVWVNPSAGYNNKADVLVKCLRAKELGMQIMIDFHYSDTWADPSKQIVPAAWQGYTAAQMADAVSAHTKDVLQTLKDNGVEVTWVQVGNEVTPGMLIHKGREGSLSEMASSVSGKVSGSDTGHFTDYFSAGYDAVKSVYPSAEVILHIDNAWKLGTLTWFFDLMATKNLTYDMIGLSLYPSYWEGSGYPDWSSKCTQALSNFKTLHDKYSKPVMLVEFGMPAAEPENAKAALKAILDGTADYDWFKGVFYWEPESEKSRNGYDYGAFSGGRSTGVIDIFSQY